MPYINLLFSLARSVILTYFSGSEHWEVWVQMCSYGGTAGMTHVVTQAAAVVSVD